MEPRRGVKVFACPALPQANSWSLINRSTRHPAMGDAHGGEQHTARNENSFKHHDKFFSETGPKTSRSSANGDAV